MIRKMQLTDIEKITDLFLPWSTKEATFARWQKYYLEQKEEKRTVGIVEEKEEILGYGSLVKHSLYPHFDTIPEISDVWIYEKHRNHGYGKKLLLWLENQAAEEGYSQIGIGVGLYKDYGPAQNLYFKLGYKPDGQGITYKEQPVVPGNSYPVDDDLILWLKKPIYIAKKIP